MVNKMGKLKDWALARGLFDMIKDDSRDDSQVSAWEEEMEIADSVLQSTFKECSEDDTEFFCSELNEAIWELSTGLFGGNEVQVVIDGNNNLFWSVGNPGYVDFPAPPIGMKLPIKCWIHTHPFGSAYFSGTDWGTINTWRPYLSRAEVLGNNQVGIWAGEKGEVYTHISLTEDFNLVKKVIGVEEE